MPYINQFLLPMLSYCVLLKISIFVNLKFQKTKTDAPVVINSFLIYLSMSSSYSYQSDQFYQNICTTFMLLYFLEFFEMFVFVYLFLWFCSVLLLLLFFPVLFLFLAKILALAVKIPDVTTAAVELNIITIIAWLLWTLEIVHYSWELPVQ